MVCDIKSRPEDFVVDEILSNGTRVSQLESGWTGFENGQFLWVAVEKRMRNTMDVAQDIARKLGLTLKRVNYGGIKDRVSVSYQVFSLNLRADPDKAVSKINDVEGIHVLAYSWFNRWIKSSDMLGNWFSLVVRDCNSEVRDLSEFPNFFGEQRFGSVKNNSADVGMYLVKDDYNSAVENYFGRPFEGDAKSFVLKNKRIFKFMVHAFQSKLFNEELELRLKDGEMDVLEGEYMCGANEFGFPELESEGSSFVVSELIGWKLRSPNKYKLYLMDKYGVDPSGFKELDVKGGWRTLTAPIIGLDSRKDGSDWYLHFSIPRGSYATVALRYLLDL